MTTAEIRALIRTCTPDLAGLRDRALLLLGYAGALRRSELVGIDREHLTFTPEGLRLLLPRSKGDQDGQGAARGTWAETCPVRALEASLAGLLVGRLDPLASHPGAARPLARPLDRGAAPLR